jgi:hypothetical protein
MVWGDNIYTGLFFQSGDRLSLGAKEPVLAEGGPLAQRPLGLSSAQADKLIRRMM